MSSRHRHALGMLAPAAIVLLALLLRSLGIGATGLWLDEAYSWKQAANPFLGVVAATAQDNYPPLHNILLHVFMALFGDSEVSLRLPSVLLGTGTVLLTYSLGRQMFGRRVGLVASLLLGLSVFHIWYSIEARMYALLGFTATLYALAVVRRTQRPGRSADLLALVSAALLLYSHVFGMFIVLTMNLVVLVHALATGRLRTRETGSWLLSQAVAGALFLPWAYVLAQRLSPENTSVGWIPAPTLSGLSAMGSKLLSGPEMVLALLIVMFGGIFWTRVAPSGPDGQDKDGPRPVFALAVLYAGILGPFLIALTISLVFAPLLVSRYLIAGLPLFFILVALVLTDTFRHPVALCCALAILVIPTALKIPVIDRPDWRTDLASEYARFEARAQDGDTVVFVPFVDPTFDYYVRGDHRYETRVGAETLADLSALDRFWLVGSVQPRIRLDRLLKRAEAAGFTEVTKSEDPGMMMSLFVKTHSSNATAP